jgi:hypothetical protein
MAGVANTPPNLQIPDIMQMGIITINGVPFRKKVRIFDVTIPRTGVASANFAGSIQLDTGPTPFLLSSLHCADTADSDTLTAQEEFLVSITDNESGYNWCDGLIPRSAMFGYREFGNQFPMEVPLRSNTRIQIAIQNQAVGMAAGNATVSLRGWQLFPLI